MDHIKQEAGIILDHSCDTRKKGEDDHEGIIVCALWKNCELRDSKKEIVLYHWKKHKNTRFFEFFGSYAE